MTDSETTPRPTGRATSPLFALAVGVALVALAAPRFFAAVAELPARPVLSELRAGATLDQRYLDIAAASRAARLDWVDDGRGWADLGLLHFTEARRLGLDSPDGRARLAESLTAHRRALALSPVQAYAWSRLAHIELLRGGPSPRLAPLLERAIATAPFDPALAFLRLELCFLAWRQLDPPLQALIGEQVRFAAGVSPKRLAVLAKERYAMAAVREALVPVPALRGRVDYFLRRL